MRQYRATFDLCDNSSGGGGTDDDEEDGTLSARRYITRSQASVTAFIVIVSLVELN